MTHQLVAFNPSAIEAAQDSLIDWCAQRIAREESLLADNRAALAAAERAGFQATAWRRRVRMCERVIRYIEKVKAALAAGYYILPPMPFEAFAVRTDRAKPNARPSQHLWASWEQPGRALPTGKGRYVSADAEVWSRRTTDLEGKEIKEYFAGNFQAPEFPFVAVHPQIIERTGAAMALGVFDRIGSLPAGRIKRDPIIAGQIMNPRTRDPVTFFIAWWLDPETLA